MEHENEKDLKSTLNIKIPQIDSTDPEERKTARSLRITKRQENLKKQEATDEEIKLESFENDESISIVEKQAAECAALLEHLLADGEEKVNNIRVASDAREVTRRFNEAKTKDDILNKLEEDADLAQKKFDEITSQWSAILSLNDPLDIDYEINLQKQRCDDLITQKNNLILDLKKESQRADETFYKDLQKQLNDIKTLGERVDAQILLMKNAYQSQLALIEQSIEMEQTTTIKNNDERWNALYNQRDRDELQNTEEKISQIADFKNKMDELLSEHREKYRITKIKLETEIQTLQNEFQDLKANCLINSEKIDYNYQILKRREEENILIRSQQQRRLNKMQDTINELKNKIKIINKNGTSEELKSNKEIQRLQNSLFELQVKANHFASINDKKYHQVWKMNQKKADDLIQSINNIDKIIHEEILELEWTPPNTDLLKQCDLPSYKNAIYTPDDLTDKKETDSKDDLNQQNYNDHLIKKIFKMVTDSSGFLIEERLWPLLEKFENVSTKLCKLDNIFNALNITEENDINLLCKYFIKYAFCEKCKIKKADAYQIEEEIELKTDDFVPPEEIETTKDEQFKCKCGSTLDILPSDALSAIRDFMAYVKTSNEQNIKSPVSSSTNLISRCLTEKDVETFWEKYKNAFTPQKMKLWENVTIALSRYVPVLQDRQKLNKEVASLRKQNSELKNLLRGHNTAEPFKQKYLTPLQKGFKIN